MDSSAAKKGTWTAPLRKEAKDSSAAKRPWVVGVGAAGAGQLRCVQGTCTAPLRKRARVGGNGVEGHDSSAADDDDDDDVLHRTLFMGLTC